MKLNMIEEKLLKKTSFCAAKFAPSPNWAQFGQFCPIADFQLATLFARTLLQHFFVQLCGGSTALALAAGWWGQNRKMIQFWEEGTNSSEPVHPLQPIVHPPTHPCHWFSGKSGIKVQDHGFSAIWEELISEKGYKQFVVIMQQWWNDAVDLGWPTDTARQLAKHEAGGEGLEYSGVMIMER